MGRTRNTLTPMIGLSLAALVAGSLVTLAVLAQRVSLNVPYADPISPRPPSGAASAPPLVVADAPPDNADDLDRDPRERDLDLPPDRVLPLRIAAPAAPAPQRGGPKGPGPDDPKAPQQPGVGHLPPGIIKKLNGGGGVPPGHARRAAAGAKRHPPGPSNGKGRGVCGEPPCGNAYGHVRKQSGGSARSHGADEPSSSPGHSRAHRPVSGPPAGRSNGHGHGHSKGHGNAPGRGNGSAHGKGRGKH